jgi:hypothetical protein
MDALLTLGRDVVQFLFGVVVIVAVVAAAVSKTARAVLVIVIVTAIAIKATFFSSPKVERDTAALTPVSSRSTSHTTPESATATFQNFDQKGGKALTVKCSGPVGNVRCVSVDYR